MLIPAYRWQVARLGDEALETDVPELARALGVPPLVARLLLLRGLGAIEPARAFLQPRLADLEAPGVLPDMDRGSSRLADAVRRGERIGVFGDYDVDGMTGTSLLVRFFRLAGGDVTWAIPDRTADGYGITPAGVERLAADGARVVVTVDNGVSALDAVARANELGLEVIVTDHHLPGPALPDAYAVINPFRADAGVAGRGLCGCGLAFKLAWAVAERLRGGAGRDAARFKEFLRDAVGLVALATVSDVVPLVGENRILVAAGLQALRGSHHPGVRALLEVARVGALPLTTEDVAFRIAPRLNAAGRLSRPHVVIELMTSTDLESARQLARQLADANAERRRIEKEVLDQAVEQAQQLLDASHGERHSLVVHGEGWHQGVIGIVAARLVDRHSRPTVVIGFDGAGGRGSCRTPEVVDLHRALTQCDRHLGRFGGHAMAAGLEIERDAVQEFQDAFEAAVREQTGGAAPVRTIDIDAEATPDDWDLASVEGIRRLAPFGEGNPRPLFLVRGAKPAGRPRLMGQNDDHIAFALKQTGGAVRVVGFRQARHYDLVMSGRPLDLVVAPTINEWKGIRTAELELVDLREHDGSAPAARAAQNPAVRAAQIPAARAAQNPAARTADQAVQPSGAAPPSK